MPQAKERIAKRLAALGVCSRRDAEKLIAQGRVAVNGAVLTTPATLVAASDILTLDGKPIAAPARAHPLLYRYHKPKGLITTHKDEKNRPTVFASLPPELPRVISVGRLDVNSEGLLLLTTSGALSRALELPKHALKRSYRVRVNGQITEAQRALLGRGITVEGVRYQPISVGVETEKTGGRNRWLSVTITEGKNREIRRVFEHLDLPVSRLIRVAYGPFQLGDLAVGGLAAVPQWQVETLMKKYAIA